MKSKAKIENGNRKIAPVNFGKYTLERVNFVWRSNFEISKAVNLECSQHLVFSKIFEVSNQNTC